MAETSNRPFDAATPDRAANQTMAEIDSRGEIASFHDNF
jgi:hypothetical protein